MGDPAARARFLELDPYRVNREVNRYEGTPQRDLFRELRVRFLERHSALSGWVVDLGSGPGRFARSIGNPGARRVLLDLSQEMLLEARRRFARDPQEESRCHLIRGDAAHPPFRPGSFQEVVLFGNVVGFSESTAIAVLEGSLELLAPNGLILLETVAGPGERSRYLTRLPTGAVRRLLQAPINLVRPRLEREGFRPEGDAVKRSGFRRFPPHEVVVLLRAHGVEPIEVMAVAPSLGGDPERVAAVRLEPRSWRHLLELEEMVGRSEARHARAAALLVAGRRTAPAAAGRKAGRAPDTSVK
ncbi:MAG: class I SAM-dependent methyltransferase [Thermoplasmata archaeon]|nr:class I SAM-dependent methyltransferase [Thermoplasmata archaeon]